MAKVIDGPNPDLDVYSGQLKPHIINHLKCGNIITLLNLRHSTEKELLSIRNIGPLAVREIKEFLQSYNLRLRA